MSFDEMIDKQIREDEELHRRRVEAFEAIAAGLDSPTSIPAEIAIRIEALRAAAQVHGQGLRDKNGKMQPAGPATLTIAALFAQWLETGE